MVFLLSYLLALPFVRFTTNSLKEMWLNNFKPITTGNTSSEVGCTFERRSVYMLVSVDLFSVSALAIFTYHRGICASRHTSCIHIWLYNFSTRLWTPKSSLIFKKSYTLFIKDSRSLSYKLLERRSGSYCFILGCCWLCLARFENIPSFF